MLFTKHSNLGHNTLPQVGKEKRTVEEEDGVVTALI